MYEQKFMERAIELAKKCVSFDEVPVGAVVVKDGRVVAESGNLKEREGNAVCHAEIVALSAAAKAVGNWWLEGCDVYVTLEPCPMCAGAIINARIKRLVYGAFDEKGGVCASLMNIYEYPFNHKPMVRSRILQDECSALLTEFFKRLR